MFTIADNLSLTYIANESARNIESANKSLAKFTESLAADPLRAFQWSGDAVEAAAAINVWTEVAKWTTINERAENPMTEQEILEKLLEHTLRAVMPPHSASSRSTSTMSNLCDDATKVAWRKVLVRLTGAWL